MADNEKTTEQLKRVIQLLQNLEKIGNTIIGQNTQIIQLLTPAPDTDIKTLGGTISTPTKK
jgi:hypothetical protein